MRRRVVDLAGGRLEYADSEGPGPAVVLLHGVLMDETLWSGVVEALGPQVRCVVPVLPLGAHTVALGARADLRPSAVADLVGQLIDALDLHDAVLVGNDTGGALAQLLLAARPDVVAGVVLVSCDAFENFPPGLPGTTMAWAARVPGGLRAAVGSLRIRALRRLPMTFGRMTVRPIDEGTFDRWLSAFAASRDVRTDLRSFLRGVDRRQLCEAAERLHRHPGPALVVWAEQDSVMPPAHADRLAAALGSARVVRIPDSRTLVPLDRPRELAALLAAHLTRVATHVGDHPGSADAGRVVDEA